MAPAGKTYRELTTNTCVNARVAHQLLFVGYVEERPMCDFGLFSYAAWVSRPGVQVSVEVNNRNRAIDFV